MQKTRINSNGKVIFAFLFDNSDCGFANANNQWAQKKYSRQLFGFRKWEIEKKRYSFVVPTGAFVRVFSHLQLTVQMAIMAFSTEVTIYNN